MRTTVLILAFAPAALAAQTPVADSAVTAFLKTARTATARYREQSAATADGYHAVGPDFPSMGEHWVSFPLVARGELDPAHPQVLEYIKVEGRPVLAGVAWALPAGEGQQPPDFPPIANAWHYHSGTVDDESFVASHVGATHHAPVGPALAVLHAWLWIDNPDGTFATDNWALPWARLGLAPAGDASADAARLLSLATGGERYFALLLRVVARPDSLEDERARAVLEQARHAVLLAVDSLRIRPGDGPALAAHWARRWQDVWQDLRAALGPDARSRMDQLGR
ncbi:MAG: hypothetical protein ACHQU1_02710 [Gemmatimonadales bacterium]